MTNDHEPNHAILKGLMAHCKQHPGCWPRVIEFEGIHLTPKDVATEVVGDLEWYGCTILSRSAYNVTMQRW